MTEQMKNLMNSIKQDANNLKSQARSLESDSSDIATHSKSCVDECIQYLNEYLNS